MPHLTIGVINNNNIALPATVVLSPHCVIAHFFTYVYRRRRSLLPPPTANITVYTNHRRLCLEHVKKADIEARDALRQGGCAIYHHSALQHPSFVTPESWSRSPRGELANARTLSAHITPLLEALAHRRQAVSITYLSAETYAYRFPPPSVPCGAPYPVILDASPLRHERDVIPLVGRHIQ